MLACCAAAILACRHARLLSSWDVEAAMEYGVLELLRSYRRKIAAVALQRAV